MVYISLYFKLIPGARPLNRLIQTAILEPLAMELISGGVGPNEEVKIRMEEDKLVVKRNHDPVEDTADIAPLDTDKWVADS
jgi:ATP-dependent Clp protease ATP-binding subunit ClpA